MTIPPLSQAISDFHHDDLAIVLRQAGVEPAPKSKRGRIDRWLKLIGDSQRIQRAYQALTPRCRQALQRLQVVEGDLLRVRYQAALERLDIAEKSAAGSRAYSWGRRDPTFADDPKTFDEILTTLLVNGLIWTHTVEDRYGSRVNLAGGVYVYVPEEVAAHLPAPPERQHPVLDIVQTLEGSARTFQRDLYLIWSAVRADALTLTNAALLRVRDLKRLSGELLVGETIATGAKEPDFRRIFFLRSLASNLGLLKTAFAGGSYTLSAKQDPSFLKSGPTERVRASFLAWRNGNWWNELWANAENNRAFPDGTVTAIAPSQVIEARLRVLELLGRTARRSVEWIALDYLSESLRERAEDFLVGQQMTRQSSSYYSYGFTTNSPYTTNSLGWQWPSYISNPHDGWQNVERAFIEAVLAEGLYWLGLVDLGYSQAVTAEGGAAPAGLTAVRLTGMGRWLLLDGPEPRVPEDQGRVVVQPNFRIFAFDPIPDHVLANLDSFANRLNVERAIEYEISRETVYRAQLAGRTALGIKSWLMTISGADLPQNVARSLDEWHAAFERIAFRPKVGLVQAASADLLDALLAQKDWQKLILARSSPTTALVDFESVDVLELALLAMEELPSRIDQAAESRRDSIALDADGSIHFAHELPNLYVRGYLRPFAEQAAEGWRITPASVRRAQKGGMDAAAILSELRDLAAGGVPGALQANIKAWGKHYGDASFQTVTLLEFQSQEVLDELLADSRLRRYLKPFKTKARLGLALVALENLAAVSALLAELGVNIKECK